MKLQPNKVDYTARDNDIYRVAIAGTINELSLELYTELSNSGYSLFESDINAVILNEVQYYGSWQELEIQRIATTATLISNETSLFAFEWAIINPVARAHCDLMQARLMESSRSLGGDGFGLTVSEANQIYLDSRSRMQIEASYEPPFSIATADGN